MKRLVLLCALLAGCAAPVPSPTPTPSGPPTIRVDGIARILTTGGLQVWRVPSAAKAGQLQGWLRAGGLVYVTGGPRVVGGATWWQVQPDDQAAPGSPFGWVLERDQAGVANLVAVDVPCPGSAGPVDAAVIQKLAMLSTLWCFGNRPIELRGLVHCSSGSVDAAVTGPSWFGTPVFCDLDDMLNLYGLPLNALVQTSNPSTDRYIVRGHFDDPEARSCIWVRFGPLINGPITLDDAAAVIGCREQFVVTSVTKLD